MCGCGTRDMQRACQHREPGDVGSNRLPAEPHGRTGPRGKGFSVLLQQAGCRMLRLESVTGASPE